MKSKRTSFVLRLSKKEREAIAAAASERGMEAPAWVRQVLLEAARVGADALTETISRRDMRALVHALEHPRRPNAALRAAFRRLKDVQERNATTLTHHLPAAEASAR